MYCDVVRYYVAVSLSAHRSTGKLLSVLASIFTELAQKVQTQHKFLSLIWKKSKIILFTVYKINIW